MKLLDNIRKALAPILGGGSVVAKGQGGAVGAAHASHFAALMRNEKSGASDVAAAASVPVIPGAQPAQVAAGVNSPGAPEQGRASDSAAHMALKARTNVPDKIFSTVTQPDAVTVSDAELPVDGAIDKEGAKADVLAVATPTPTSAADLIAVAASVAALGQGAPPPAPVPATEGRTPAKALSARAIAAGERRDTGIAVAIPAARMASADANPDGGDRDETARRDMPANISVDADAALPTVAIDGARTVVPTTALAGTAAAPVASALADRVIDMGVGGQWIDDVSHEIARMADSNGNASFRLMPPNLGAMRIDVRQADAGTHVRMTVETQAAMDALRTGSDALASEARLSGARIASVDIEMAAGQQLLADTGRVRAANPADGARQDPASQNSASQNSGPNQQQSGNTNNNSGFSGQGAAGQGQSAGQGSQGQFFRKAEPSPVVLMDGDANPVNAGAAPPPPRARYA